jgi:hypothetical protein
VPNRGHSTKSVYIHRNRPSYSLHFCSLIFSTPPPSNPPPPPSNPCRRANPHPHGARPHLRWASSRAVLAVKRCPRRPTPRCQLTIAILGLGLAFTLTVCALARQCRHRFVLIIVRFLYNVPLYFCTECYYAPDISLMIVNLDLYVI